MATRRGRGESEPMTLGQALAAHVRLIVWCKSCNHRSEPDIAIQVAQHGSGMPVLDWARLLRCTECSARPALRPRGAAAPCVAANEGPQPRRCSNSTTRL